MILGSSGTDSSPITFGAYGSGNNPIISGADEIRGAASDWSNESANIWLRNISSSISPQPTLMFFNGTAGEFTNLSNMSAKGNWYYNESENVTYVYVFSEGNPANDYSSIELSARERGIYAYNANYTVIKDLTVEKVYDGVGGNNWLNKGAIILRQSSYCNISNNTVRSASIGILSAIGSINNKIYSNTINGFWVGRTADWTGIGIWVFDADNTVSNNDVNGTIHLINGTVRKEGVGIAIEKFPGYAPYNGIISSNNISNTDEYGIIVWNGDTNSGIVEVNISIYNNYIHKGYVEPDDYTGLAGDRDGIALGSTNPAIDERTANRLTGITIYRNTVEEYIDSGIYLCCGHGENVTIHHNIVKNCGSPKHNLGVGGIGVESGAKVYNNVVYNQRSANGIVVSNDSILNPKTTEVRNNIIHTVVNDSWYGKSSYGIATSSDAGAGSNVTVIVSNNIIFNVSGNNNTFFNNANGIYNDPLFVDPSAGNFRLRAASPGIDAGISVDLTRDFEDSFIYLGLAPDIGAFEFDLPKIVLSTPNNSAGSNEGAITFNYNVSSTSNVTNCSLILNGVINATNVSIAKESIQNFTQNLHFGGYNWSINCTNTANNTGSSLARKLSIIRKSSFNGTDLTAITNMSNISNFYLEESSYGKINFSEIIDLSNGADINSYVQISENSISIDSAALPALNKSAILSLYGLSFSNPRILKDGAICPSSICQRISYSNGTLIFNVSHFTAYSSEETPVIAASSTSSSTLLRGSKTPYNLFKIFKAIPNRTIELDVRNAMTKVYKIYLDVKKEASLIEIKIEKLENLPTLIQMPAEKVYEIIRINSSNLEDSNVDLARIRFEIGQPWLIENSLNPESIYLQRYDNGWEKLPTKILSSGSQSYYYEAVSPGFSIFAITAEKKTEKQEEIPLIGNATEQRSGLNLPEEIKKRRGIVLPIVLPVAAIAILALAIILIKMKKRKPEKR